MNCIERKGGLKDIFCSAQNAALFVDLSPNICYHIISLLFIIIFHTVVWHLYYIYNSIFVISLFKRYFSLGNGLNRYIPDFKVFKNGQNHYPLSWLAEILELFELHRREGSFEKLSCIAWNVTLSVDLLYNIFSWYNLNITPFLNLTI